MSGITPDRPWAALPRELAAVLRPELPTLADEVIEALRHGVPAYARPLEGPFGRGLRVGVEEALRQFVDEIDGGPRRFDRNVYVELGRGELRAGRSLDVLLAAYRLGARVAWRRLAEAGRADGVDADTLYLLAESIFAYIDQLSALSAEGYASAQSDAAGAHEMRRRQLVRLLVQDPPADPVSIEAAALDAGWQLPAELAVLVVPDEEGRRAPRLPAYAVRGTTAEGLCAVVPDPRAPGRHVELARALRNRVAALGPPVPWIEAPASLARASAVLRLVAEGTVPASGLVHADDHAAALLVTADRRMAREVAQTRLAPLDELTPAARERLLDTLEAWLAAQGRVQDAASVLHVHPQTVRYRLARLRELLGDALDDPEARFELDLALRARRLLGTTAAG